MAILWSKKIAGVTYEVRQAGKSIRLYTDGVFHSQYHPDRAWCGGVWDLLLLPLFFYPKEQLRRVLVLGVGGGAIIRQIDNYFHPDEIIGVELNKTHIQIAKRFFSVSQKVATLHHADAIEWVKNYQGDKFDLIIEDLFGEEKGEPLRAIKADAKWFKQLHRLLKPNGMLVMNFINSVEIRECAYLQDEHINGLFKIAHKFSLESYENNIAAFLKEEVFKDTLYKNITSETKLNQAVKSKKIKFRLRQLVRY